MGARLAKVAKTTHQSEQARSTGPPWTPVFGPEKVFKQWQNEPECDFPMRFCNGVVRFGALVVLTGLGE